LNSPLRHSPLSPRPWHSFHRSRFSIFIPVCTVFAPNHPPVPSPQILPHPLFCPLVLNICKKNWHFYLFKISLQRASLWQFHNRNWFILSIFLLSTLVPFLWWFQHV
jgi:hypothetical protein